MKFKIVTKMPGEKMADLLDPFGETGFSSIKWWYGTMIMRPERLALIKTVAKV
jgi:N4-gp56 family major capsid protein